jgi:hypothetical protein
MFKNNWLKFVENFTVFKNIIVAPKRKGSTDAGTTQRKHPTVRVFHGAIKKRSASEIERPRALYRL